MGSTNPKNFGMTGHCRRCGAPVTIITEAKVVYDSSEIRRLRKRNAALEEELSDMKRGGMWDYGLTPTEEEER